MKYINSIKLNNEDYEVSSAEEITYAALKAKRDAGELVPGRSYRIIDYDFRDNLPAWKSAHHKFDIICTAIGSNIIAKNACAANHINDTYFKDSDLSSWHLKIDLDKTDLITELVDEFNNSCPYDFKNTLWPVASELTLTHDDLNNYKVVLNNTYELLPEGIGLSPVSIVDYWNHICDSSWTKEQNNNNNYLKLIPMFLPVQTQANLTKFSSSFATNYTWHTPQDAAMSADYLVGYGDVTMSTLQPYFFGVGVKKLAYAYTFSSGASLPLLEDSSIKGFATDNIIITGNIKSSNILFGIARKNTISGSQNNIFVKCSNLSVSSSNGSSYRNLSGNIYDCLGSIIIGKNDLRANRMVGRGYIGSSSQAKVDLFNVRGSIIAAIGTCNLEGVIGCYGQVKNSTFKNYVSKFASNTEIDGEIYTYLFRHINLIDYNSDNDSGDSKTLLVHPFEYQWWAENATVRAFSTWTHSCISDCTKDISYKFWSDQPTLGLSQFVDDSIGLLQLYPGYKYIKAAPCWPNLYTDTLIIEDNFFENEKIDLKGGGLLDDNKIDLMGQLPSGVTNLKYKAIKHTFIAGPASEELTSYWNLTRIPFLDGGLILSNMYQYFGGILNISLGDNSAFSTAWTASNNQSIVTSNGIDNKLVSLNFANIKDITANPTTDDTINIDCPNLTACLLNFAMIDNPGQDRIVRIDLSNCPWITVASLMEILRSYGRDPNVSLLFILNSHAILSEAFIPILSQRLHHVGFMLADGRGGLGNWQI